MEATLGHTDHGASKAAAVAMRGNAAALRDQVRDVLRQFPEGITADEIASLLDRSVLSVRPRVSELVKGGEAIKTSERRTTASGLTASVVKPVLCGGPVVL